MALVNSLEAHLPAVVTRIKLLSFCNKPDFKFIKLIIHNDWELSSFCPTDTFMCDRIRMSLHQNGQK